MENSIISSLARFMGPAEATEALNSLATQRANEPDKQKSRYSDSKKDRLLTIGAIDCQETDDEEPALKPSIPFLVLTAREAAEEFAKLIEDDVIQQWQLIFRLAKRLRAIPGTEQLDVTKLFPILQAFRERLTEIWVGAHFEVTRRNTEEHWLEFVDVWEKVKFPDGKGPLELAFERAKREQIRPLPNLSDDYGLIASTAYHLQHLQGDEPILLPVDHIGRLLNKDKKHGSRIVQLLVRYGLIRVMDADYSYAKHKAKTYKFVFDSGRYMAQGV